MSEVKIPDLSFCDTCAFRTQVLPGGLVCYRAGMDNLKSIAELMAGREATVIDAPESGKEEGLKKVPIKVLPYALEVEMALGTTACIEQVRAGGNPIEDLED